jgi:hypothetical protein
LALDKVGVDNVSDLYNKGRKFQPYKVTPTEETEEIAAENPQEAEKFLVEDVNEGVEDATEEEDIIEIYITLIYHVCINNDFGLFPVSFIRRGEKKQFVFV